MDHVDKQYRQRSAKTQLASVNIQSISVNTQSTLANIQLTSANTETISANTQQAWVSTGQLTFDYPIKQSIQRPREIPPIEYILYR